MFGTDSNDARTENFLSALTDALLSGRTVDTSLAARYGVSQSDASEYTRIIDALSGTLVPVHPSRKFVRLLRQDLIGSEESGVVASVRSLPPRVQIAAGLALLAGFFLLLRRRNAGQVGRSHEPGTVPVS